MSSSGEEKRTIIIRILLLTGLLVIFVAFLLSPYARHFLNAVHAADVRIFLLINQHHQPVLDKVMYFASGKFVWIPFYALLIYLLFRSFGREAWKVLILVFFLIFASDQIASDLIKNSVKRLRPSHELALIPAIHLSKDGPGGLYGFASSHASNSAALMLFLTLIFKRKYNPVKYILLLWMLLVSYSRIYNGVHYPSDVLAGLLIGFQLAVVFYMVFQLLFFGHKPDELPIDDARAA